MKKIVKYIIDNDHGICDMYTNDRRSINHCASTRHSILGVFVQRLSSSLDSLKDGQTLTIEVTLEE